MKYLFFILIISFNLVASAQISPGDLSNPHKHLEGIKNCTQCHVLGDKVTNEKCLECHKEINQRITNQSGFHASTEVQGKECLSCHNEHHGREYDLMALNKNEFNHNLTGYILEDEHAKLDCAECHKKEFIQENEFKEHQRTYLGLNTQCITCHDDFHQNTLSDNCLSCHNYKAFRPAEKFNHDDANFKLLGKHQNVDCIECHKMDQLNGKEFQHFANVEHSNCTSCHDDVHNNQFGQNCIECHNNNSFHQVRNIDNFDHSRTNYPLEGMHQKVECKACHTTGNYTDPLSYNRCSACHEDEHNGQFINKNPNSDCNDCHGLVGFNTTYYTIEQHNQSNFKLTGAHWATPCFACHLENDKWQFTNKSTNCIACHQNEHEGLMSIEFTNDNGCAICHNENTWQHVDFDHNRTNYQLEGKHASTECKACHYRKNSEQIEDQKFHNTSQACLTCHNDEHQGQFSKYGDEGCLNCHTFNNWEASKFNHQNTNFQLDGAHASLDCVECHATEKNKGKIVTNYTYEDFKCAVCHK